MPKSLPFFKFDADAWLTGKAQILSAQEKGIFIDMVAIAWKENGIIRNDDFLHRALRIQKGTLSKAKATLLSAGLITEKDGSFVVNLVEKQLKTINSYILKQREFGKLGGRKKKATLRLPLGYPKATLSEETKENLSSPTTPSIKENKEDQNSSEVPSSEFTLEPEISGSPGRRKPEKIFFDYDGDSKLHGITPEQIAYWQEMYPALDVEAELKKASSWLDGNRKNRKTDVKRYLVNWLSRAQDRARTTNTTPLKDYTGL